MASKKKTFSTRKQSSSLFLAHTKEEYKDFLFFSFSLTRERNKWREWKETLKDLRRGCKNIASLPSPHTVGSFNEKCHYPTIKEIGVAGGGIRWIYTMSRTFLISPFLDLVRTVAAARQSKTLPVSALLCKVF